MSLSPNITYSVPDELDELELDVLELDELVELDDELELELLLDLLLDELELLLELLLELELDILLELDELELELEDALELLELDDENPNPISKNGLVISLSCCADLNLYHTSEVASVGVKTHPINADESNISITSGVTSHTYH